MCNVIGLHGNSIQEGTREYTRHRDRSLRGMVIRNFYNGHAHKGIQLTTVGLRWGTGDKLDIGGCKGVRVQWDLEDTDDIGVQLCGYREEMWIEGGTRGHRES